MMNKLSRNIITIGAFNLPGARYARILSLALGTALSFFGGQALAQTAQPPAGSQLIQRPTYTIRYLLLERMLIACNGADSTLARAIGSELKGKLSMLIYAVAMPLAFIQPWIAIMLYIVVALIWFVPDRRIESMM
jgi:uncharacterized membrane protein